MRKSNHIATFFYKILLIVSIAWSFQACNACSGQGGQLDNNPKASGVDRPKVVLIFSHGLNETAASMHPWMDAYAKEDLGGEVIPIAIDRPNNAAMPLEDQSKLVADETLKELTNRDLLSPNTRIVLIGNSQGALVTYSAYVEKMDPRIKDLVVGLISRNGPLCGAPGVSPNPVVVNQIDVALAPLVQGFIPGFSFQKHLLDPFLGNGKGGKAPGVTELDPASPFIRKVMAFPDTEVPLLCLSGDLGSKSIVDVLLDTNPTLGLLKGPIAPHKKTIEPLLNQIIGGGQPHDSLVPTDSQKGGGLANKNKIVFYLPGYNHFSDFLRSSLYPESVKFIKKQVQSKANK
jgi:pimeloyl-ACP methyl ester carboxylesterase